MAMRLWTPADLVGVTGIEIVDTTKNVATSDGTFAVGTPVTTITSTRPGGGTPLTISAFRDDFRPVIGSFNGLQTVLFDTSTRQLDIPTKTNLPNGTGDKWWFEVVKVLETRTDDRYTWGYGGSNQTSVAYKLRVGAVPYVDVGSTGYAIGSTAVSASGISMICEQYTASDTTSKANYNGTSTWTSYVKARNTSISQLARYGYWPLYGNGCNHHLLKRVSGYGVITADDWLRMIGWASWASGDQGNSIVDRTNPYINAAPMIDDGTGGGVVKGTGALVEADDTAAATVTARVSASAAIIEQDDLMVAMGNVRVAATVALVEQDDVVVATAQTLVKGQFAATEDDDTVVGTATARSSFSANIVEQDDIMVAMGNARVTATVALVEQDDVAEAYGRASVRGSAMIIEADDTAVGSMGVQVVLRAEITEQDDLMVASSGVRIMAVVALVEQDDVAVGTAKAVVSGRAALVEADDIAYGTVTPPLKAPAGRSAVWMKAPTPAVAWQVTGSRSAAWQKTGSNKATV